MSTWRDRVEQLQQDLESADVAALPAVLGALVELEERIRLRLGSRRPRPRPRPTSQRALGDEIVELLDRSPGLTSNALALRVAAARARVLATLRDLEAAGCVTYTPGPRGARLWRRATGSSGTTSTSTGEPVDAAPSSAAYLLR